MCSVKKIFLEILQNSQKSTCASLFFNKFVGLRPATLLKKRLWHRCFPVNFAKFLRTTFLTEHLRWLLLYLDKSIGSADDDWSNRFETNIVTMKKQSIDCSITFTCSKSTIETLEEVEKYIQSKQ